MYTILIQDLKNFTYTEDCKNNYYILTIEIKTIETLYPGKHETLHS